MSISHPHSVQKPDLGTTVTKAVVRAGETLSVTSSVLAHVIGVSEATLSRMKTGDFVLKNGTKPFELAVLFIRLFRSLDAILGGDEGVAAKWMSNANITLQGRPIEKIQTVTGLMDVIAYLDARRALV